MNIVETLKNSMPLMTAKQQHIAGFMVNNPSEMCYISLKDFSSQVGCTEATAIRFCQKLGYASFTDAKNAFRSIQAAKAEERFSVSGAYGAAGASVAVNEDFIKKQLEIEKEYTDALFSEIVLPQLEAIADEIQSAHTVYIVGRGTSYSVADFMMRRLSLFGIKAYAINPEEMTSLQSSINRLSPKDLFIFMVFPVYYLPIINVARYVKEHGANVIGFTDSSDSLLTKHCDQCLLMGDMHKGHYYSYASIMIYFNIILSMVQLRTKEGDLTRFKAILEEISHPDYQGSDYQQVSPL